MAAVGFFMVAGAGSAVLRLRGQTDVYGLVALFNVDVESSAPTWFSAAVLLCCVLVLLVLTLGVRAARRRSWRNWGFLTGVFTVMSVDEVAAYHESWIFALREVFGADGIFFFAWVVPGSIMVAVVGIPQVRFLRELPRPTAVRFVAAGGIFVSGGLGMEMVNGWYFNEHGGYNLVYASLVGIEELLEMVGALAFLRALLLHLDGTAGAVTIAIPSPAWTGRAETVIDLREDHRAVRS